MDQALKQRLVGATVLIVLGVVLLPMLLSGQPEFQNETARIEVPEKPPELSVETRRFPVGGGDPVQPPKVDEQPIADPEPQAKAGEAAVAADEPAPVESARSERVEAAAAPAAESVIDPEPAVETAPSPGRYLVQVASFSNPGNANNLAALLRENQLPVVMDNVVTGAGRLHRVRVGPFDELSAADASVERIRALLSDLSPRVVDLRPDENAPVTDPSDPLVRWVVQVGSFAEEANAAELSARLREAGFTAFVELVSDASGTAWKVKIGPVIERQSAVQLAAELKQKLAIDGLVMSGD
jgi:DedD protein